MSLIYKLLKQVKRRLLPHFCLAVSSISPSQADLLRCSVRFGTSYDFNVINVYVFAFDDSSTGVGFVNFDRHAPRHDARQDAISVTKGHQSMSNRA